VRFRENRQKEWISKETWKEIERRILAKENANRSKRRQQKISTQAQYSEINKRVKRRIGKDKRNWINEKAKLTEKAKKKGEIRDLHSITRKLSPGKFKMNRPVKTNQECS